MATFTSSGAPCAPAAPHADFDDDPAFALNDFEAELKQLAAANQELLAEFHTTDDHADEPAPVSDADHDELTRLREENNSLRIRLEELEALAGGHGEELWHERQREYEMLLEEKSEVIRGLHQKMHEMQESVDLGAEPAPAASGASSVRLGQAEEILRLKREMDDQRRQLEQDEQDMMRQMRQMEMTMAKERAEMARQRQEVQRLQAEMTRETEQAQRAPELHDKLQSLRRERPADAPAKPEQKSSGFFRRIFG